MSNAPKSKKSSGILAIVKRKKSKKESPQDFVVTQEETVQAAPETATMEDNSHAELSKQLAEAYEDLDLAEMRIDEDTKKIEALTEEVDALRKKSSDLESKVSEMESVGAELDDTSFDAAQEFQYKKQIEELQGELEERKNLEKQLSDTKLELQEVRAQYETVQFQQQRSKTRDKMKSISDEKNSKEEVVRLQKDLRTAERKLQQQESMYEAKLKVKQESIQRVQEKNKAIQKRCDEMDKERLQLKVEKSRLEKKIEKTGSYAEKKRIKTEQEAAEMELNNMKKKHAKLEKRLSMSTQMLDLIGQGSSMMLDGVPDSPSPISEFSPSSSGLSSPVPAMTLSEARIMSLEKELEQLDLQLTTANEENEALRNRATTAEKNVDSLSMKLKEVDSDLFNEKRTSSSLEMEAEMLRQQATTPISPMIEDDESLQAQLKKLENDIQQSDIKFRVKEKDLWSTIEAQKKQISELEMDKIVLEERLLEDEATDVEDDEPDKKLTNSTKEIEALEQQLQEANLDNKTLKDEIDRLKAEALEIMESLETDLADSTDGDQKELLKQQNMELKSSLEDKSEQYVDTIREIARLRNIIEDQVTIHESYNHVYRAVIEWQL